MKRVAIALLLGGAALLAVVGTAREPRSRATLAHELGRGSGHAFALADHTDFDWDLVFLFAPYTQRDQIEAAVSSPWPGRFDSDIAQSDRIVLLVFVKGGRVIESFDLPRSPADLAPCTDVGRRGIARAAARFRILEDGTVSLADTPGSN